MRISDWSSDVCSSDLLTSGICRMTITATLAIACALLMLGHYLNGMASAQHSRRVAQLRLLAVQEDLEVIRLLQQHRGLGVQSEPTAVALRCTLATSQIGRASCRERVGQYV